MKTNCKKVLRDIKDRRFQFLAIIIVLSLGASMYYGLNTMTKWREDSLDYTYDILNWEDLQIDLLPGAFINSSFIIQELTSIEEFKYIEAVELRLVLTTAINISAQDQFTIISGKLIGSNVTYVRPASGTNLPEVNGLHIETGRYFAIEESNEFLTIADKRLFEHYNITLGNNLSIITPTGRYFIELIGSATFSDYLILVDDNSMGLFSEKQYTVLQMPLSSIQNMFFLKGQINQVLIRVTNEDYCKSVKTAIKKKLKDLEIDSTVSFGYDHPVYDLQYTDLENDNQLFFMIAILFLISGIFGTYVTINRLTTSQRREIGISLALGFKPKDIINQYLLYALVICVLSTLITLLLGTIIAIGFWDMTKSMFGVPYYHQSTYLPPLMASCFIIFIIPATTVFLTVIRMSRKIPVELIRFDPSSTHVSSSRTLLEKTIFRFIRLSVSTKISLRNLFRHRRRTSSTVLGVLVSLILMGSMWGLLNTFDSGIQTAEENIGAWNLKLEGKSLTPSAIWENNINSLPSNYSIESYILTLQAPIRFPEYQEVDGSDYYRLLEGIPDDASIRTINLIEGEFSLEGLVISKKTADELGVYLGDELIVEHIVVGGPYGVYLQNSTVKIIGIHDQVFASYCFTSLKIAQTLYNATDMINGGYIVINEESDEQSIIEDFYSNIYGINKIISRKSLIEETKALFDIFYNIIMVAQGLCMILALGLIYNSIYSNIHERKREIGTLRTLGTPSRSIIRYIFLENMIMIVIGLVIGYFAGYYAIDLFLQEVFSETFPHLYVPTVITFNSWLIIIMSTFVILGIAHLSVISFLKNLDLVGATKVRE